MSNVRYKNKLYLIKFFLEKVSNINTFFSERLNPNGCTARGTFFVSHKYTNYSAVQVNESSSYCQTKLFTPPL
jgi:hypothetical protein